MSKNWVITHDKFLDLAQARRLLRHLDLEADAAAARGRWMRVRDAMLVKFLLNSGLRVTEACSATVGDLDLKRGRCSVTVRRGKGGKVRVVKLDTGFKASLKAYLAALKRHGYAVGAVAPLFPGTRGKGHLSRSGAYRVWKSALRRAGVEAGGIHTTRHSFATALYRRTRDLRLVQQQLGHSSVVTTQVYSHVLDEDVDKAMKGLWDDSPQRK